MASRAAAIFFFLHIYFSLIGKYCPFLKKVLFFAKMKKKKKGSSRTFFSHPGGLPETELFLWTALDLRICVLNSKPSLIGRAVVPVLWLLPAPCVPVDMSGGLKKVLIRRVLWNLTMSLRTCPISGSPGVGQKFRPLLNTES